MPRFLTGVVLAILLALSPNDGVARVFAETGVGQATPAIVQECNCGGRQYQQALRSYTTGNQFAMVGNPQSVDWFLASALLAWGDVNEGLSAQPPRLQRASLQLYNSAVLSCMIFGHRLGRLDPSIGLTVLIDDQWHIIPLVNKELSWRLDQIDCFQPPAQHCTNPHFARSVRQGVGAALVGIHNRRSEIPGEKRFLDKHPIPMTVVLRSSKSPDNADAQMRLEIHNPVKHLPIQVAGHELNLSNNIAAAVSYAVEELETDVNPLTAFFQPDIAVNHEGLLLLQPYQPNKIPIVLVHGLLSNPGTWGTMINEILNNPEFMKRFQVWAYLYPTSVPFLKTAANLRRDLQDTRIALDPRQQDPALQNMVLIGHSMGGLLTRLQVTWSGQLLWDEFAKIPLGDIRAEPAFKQLLSEVFFFCPQPYIKRVIFIAVPHKGSGLSSRAIGCIGRLLAGTLPELQTQWSDLRKNNPGAFRRGVPRRLPSSIAGLAPNSPGLAGIAKLPFSLNVHRHSIIGTGGCEPCFPGDGVVAIKSARLAGVESELFVDATHTGAKEHQETLREVERILWLHWQAYQQQSHDNSPVIQTPIPAPSPMEPMSNDLPMKEG